MNHRELLEELLIDIQQYEKDYKSELPEEVTDCIDMIVKQSENNKAVLAVVMTLSVHKIIDKNQDIRFHQSSMENGFSGRTKDTLFITPFLKAHNFPSMAESGWLTRSLEQSLPYDLAYPGKITPVALKIAFLQLIDYIQVGNVSPLEIVRYMLFQLVKLRDSRNIALAKPHSLSISDIVDVLEKHFNYNYKGHGASRLLTLAIYAAYECMMKQVARYEGKLLCQLESHTSADYQSGQIGDIQINNADGTAFEGLEIKHNIIITRELVSHAYEKFMSYRTNRYYLLTTANMESADWKLINSEIRDIMIKHGCQVIVNGVYSSLKYYLRLLNDPSEFIDHYVELLKRDENIKFVHKKAWNEIIGGV